MMMFEAKCRTPVENNQCTSVYYTLSKYYVLQVLAEMKTYGCDQLLFVCWSEESTVVFETKFDEELWENVCREICEVYDWDQPRRPARRSAMTHSIAKQIDLYLLEKTKLVAEIPSATMVISEVSRLDSSFDGYKNSKADTLDHWHGMVHGTKNWIQSTYELNRSLA